MKMELLVRAAQILRTEPAYTMPAVKLHTRLVAELGSEAGSYAEMHQMLKHRADSFILLDAPRLLPSAEAWPAQIRAEYEAALKATGSCTRVALLETAASAADNGALSMAGRTLSSLWPAAQSNDSLRALIRSALEELAELDEIIGHGEAERSTTPPRHPRQ